MYHIIISLSKMYFSRTIYILRDKSLIKMFTFIQVNTKQSKTRTF